MRMFSETIRSNPTLRTGFSLGQVELVGCGYKPMHQDTPYSCDLWAIACVKIMGGRSKDIIIGVLDSHEDLTHAMDLITDFVFKG